ncbi:MarR family winged helix-turn-helix transcriptional regulator [Nonomuraea sp. NPDC050556]|uniref:MarR family winged helix-turn-helix transcriptional regulator n=1 Tax=Nonomuraea sp. NPDC050556 TaxID=3364369 RepID=UPI0037940FCF
MSLAETGSSPTERTEEDQRQDWIALVKVLLVLPGALEAQLLRDSDLTLLGYMILARLDDTPDATLRMSQIATMANGSLPRTSQAISRLENRGWVRRTVISGRGQGRRFTTARLTEAGRAQLAAATPEHTALVRRLVIEPAGDQFSALGSVAQRIVEALGLPARPAAD